MKTKRKMLGALIIMLALALGASGVASAALYTDFENFDKWVSSGDVTQWSFNTPPDFNVPPYDYTANLFIRGFFVGSDGNQVAVNGKWVGNLSTSSFFTLFASNTNINIGQVFLPSWTGGTSFDVSLTAIEPLYLDYSKFVLNYTPTSGGGGGSTGGGGGFTGGGAVHTPEPGTMVLLGSGLIGLAAYGRKKVRK